MVINRQKRVRVAPQPLEHFLSRVRRALRLPRASATVCLVTDAQIAKWNRAYRGKSKPTDVLSFLASTDTPPNGSRLSCHSARPERCRREPGRRGDRCEESAVRFLHDEHAKNSRGKGIRRRVSYRTLGHGSYLGDIAIAPAVARRNARRSRRSLDDELRVLILHGVLHLLGYDHETDHGEMERLELRLRRRLEID
ncbi:MAG TPA: rRNA maturation RNase YbeY [Candidatus Acidoferrales bacterium]|nr:rRNA maturation RNase YbeY [Candidatus Acidoferrales bacterium]